MPTDRRFANLARRSWLIDGPFKRVVTSYIDALCLQRYADCTISSYLGCLADFNFWIKGEAVELTSVDSLLNHPPKCMCLHPAMTL